MAYIRSDQEFLPYAHEAIPRGYSEQTVLKEGMFEDLSLANKQLWFVLIFLMVCLLLNRREMVRQLLNQFKVLVDECKRTFQPWPMGNEKGNSYWENCHQILTEVRLKNLFVPMHWDPCLQLHSNNPRMFVQVESLPDNNTQVGGLVFPLKLSNGLYYFSYSSIPIYEYIS